MGLAGWDPEVWRHEAEQLRAYINHPSTLHEPIPEMGLLYFHFHKFPTECRWHQGIPMAVTAGGAHICVRCDFAGPT